MPRFTLKQFFLAVAVFGLFLGSLRFAAPVPARMMFYALLALLTFSIVAAIYAREPRRPFWVGFAVFGCMAMAVLNFHFLIPEPEIGDHNAGVRLAFHPLRKESLPTTVLSRALYRLLRPGLEIGQPMAPSNSVQQTSYGRVLSNDDPRKAQLQYTDGTRVGPGPYHVAEQDFLDVLGCWWVVLAGVVGGVTARWMQRRGAGEAVPERNG